MQGRLKLKGQILTYLIYPFVMAVVLLFVGVWITVADPHGGSIVLSIAIGYIILTVVMYLYNQKLVIQEMIQFAMDYAQVQKKLLDDMVLPYILMDQDGNILWKDHVFSELMKRESDKTICEFFPEITKEKLQDEQVTEIHVNYNNEYYRVVLNRMTTEGMFENMKVIEIEQKDCMIALYMINETRQKILEREQKEQKLVVGHIYVDNYEEVLQSVEDVRGSILSALIDRKINKFVNNMNGIVKKLEKDKYFIVFQNKYLDALRSDKFSIVDEIKQVNLGNEMQVTISVGIGIGSTDFEELSNYSRAAMDLALGRGGDQAVVKDGENIYYYGGKTRLVEKNTRVKARVKAHAIREIMETKEQVLIMGHQMGDSDSLGSAFGIYKAASVLGKKAHIIVNEITASIRPMIQRFEESGEYAKDMFIQSDAALNYLNADTLVVVVDVNKPSRTECPELLKKTDQVIVLDHHRQTSEVIENTLLAYIEPYASSACEMVAEILQYFQDGIKLKPMEADAMYAGIVIDTNNFVQKTGVRTFEAAAFLRRHGADVVRVKMMFRESFQEYKRRVEAVSRADIFMNCFAITVCDADGVDSPTVLGAQVANELLEINGIEASFVLTAYKGKIYVSARSIDKVNVQLVMERMGGGGHMNMAGVQIEGGNLDEVKMNLIETVRMMRKENII